MALSKPVPLPELAANRRMQLTILKAALEFRDVLFPFRSVKDYSEDTPTNYKKMVILFVLCIVKWRPYLKGLLNNSTLRNSPLSMKTKIALLIGLFGHFLLYKAQVDVKQHLDLTRYGQRSEFTREGLFGMVRYPQLTGAMLQALGAAFYMESKPGIAIAIFTSVLTIYNTGKSEKQFEKDGNQEFSNYRNAVPYKFLPNIL